MGEKLGSLEAETPGLKSLYLLKALNFLIKKIKEDLLCDPGQVTEPL